MKMIKLLAGAALAGGLISSTFASEEAPTAWPQSARTDKPTVTKVVNPTGVPQRHEGATVDVTFTVDANGQPHHIKVLSPADPDLTRSLVPAIAQWRFTPAQKNGAPVSTRVLLPLKLVSKA